VKKYGKVFGYFDGPIPNLVITDVDMIKAMFVKDFDHFADRRVRHLNPVIYLKLSWTYIPFYSLLK
jgi:cytochrome P450 family 3 subfamily A